MLYGGYGAPPEQTSWQGGRGGYDSPQTGYISALTFAGAMQGLMGDKLASAEEAWRNGSLQNPYILQELRAQRDRFATTVANNGQTGQMFSRPQFEMNAAYAEMNEAARQWGGTTANVDNYLPGYFRGYNTGDYMRPWQSTAIVGSNFGSDAPIAMGGIARNQSNTAPSDANRASAFSGAYNGGQPMGSGSYLGGPGGRIPSLPFGSQGPVTSYGGNNGPGSSWATQNASPGSSSVMRNNAMPGQQPNYSPYRQNQPDRVLDMYQPNSPANWTRTSGATVAPYAGPTTVDYRMQPQSYTQKLSGDVNNFAGGAAGALRNFNSDLQGSMSSIPASVRGDQMSRDMGVFGYGNRQYQPAMHEVYGPWNMSGMYASGNNAINQGMLDAYFGPHYSYNNPYMSNPLHGLNYASTSVFGGKY